MACLVDLAEVVVQPMVALEVEQVELPGNLLDSRDVLPGVRLPGTLLGQSAAWLVEHARFLKANTLELDVEGFVMRRMVVECPRGLDAREAVLAPRNL